MAYDALYWRDELKRYEEESRKFIEAGKKIIKRFRDERKESDNYESRFNILWSNVKTLKPAIILAPQKSKYPADSKIRTMWRVLLR